MEKYNWAVNKIKLQRAIAKVGELDEEAVKKEYILIGGLLERGYETEAVTTEPTHLEVPEEIEQVAEEVAKEVAPKVKINKRGRPSKNAK